MLRKHSQIFLLLFKISDISAVLVSSLVAWHLTTLLFFFDLSFLAFTMSFMALWFLLSFGIPIYDQKRSKSIGYELTLIVKMLFAVALILIPLTSLLAEQFPQNYSIIAISFYTVYAIISRIASKTLLTHFRKKGYNSRRLLIVGGGEIANTLLEKVYDHPEFGYKDPICVSDSVEYDSLKQIYRGSVSELETILTTDHVDDVIVAYPHYRENEIPSIVAACENRGIRVRIIPDIFRMIHCRPVLEDIDNLPLIGLMPEPLLSLWNRTVKRTFDILFSLCVLVSLSPLFLLLILLVKMTSKGPVFFAQERIGHNNKLFMIYKFRTMRVQEKNESDKTWGAKSDSRVTPIGSFLRKSNLDELPQFWNVLIGNMSVVGPRPEREFFADQFATQIHGYRIRHLVRVGITGWAQVNGLRGDTSIPDRVKHDIYYIQNWSFFFDLKIIFLTVFGKNENAM